MPRVGVLTGGGDCPGLNAVIRAVARRSLDRGWEVVGVREGWRGLVESKTQERYERALAGILSTDARTAIGRNSTEIVDDHVELRLRRSGG